ncbi:bifunctional 4-hydroxy-2-oxoglutarate aldolase/2-dehydro-3-deoxy-phosphogluconate aldolase [Aestuariirhabdus litorea]|uniref:2-dehydro-3-deoxy-phosphogluconate aldolase n=1 Tax=Aestuariirhabdus litorea TaxID=2528527 RepID=A0A3P3VT84_9GAMM|nr:bifunctional 4-hydroxy-2-oxoglutarate aldolase/2-dehydro-3-deoxy-phosphogluconate aldolase [Aestuariirhabdus litorea]RRJ83973.1 bifunctional 4-hydroxy-2-oxoglutarate aldolase/2-dehydro-3-deoxy-phosphogluconate aldolase [Aestuariirhabdus litorea]RWW97193.1 bifunctional 4-hydroxy-2-oxoglutarate aldolase/2-dehydro-3-deoxy-phosphogluconate aldolase [Endozoicomonadaceae bacterium GTF-13]
MSRTEDTRALSLLSQTPVLPVLVIDNWRHAVPLARALLAGGISVLEVTLRTDQGLSAIRAIRDEVGEVVVGAGTLTRPAQFAEVAAAGAQFAISPGLTPALLEAAREQPLPYVPAVASASELMMGMERGFHLFKLFPAASCGGTAMLKSLAGPFPEARFCPTGGIGADNFCDYLGLPSVVTVGGSWVAPASLIAGEAWQEIEARARRACEAAREAGVYPQ